MKEFDDILFEIMDKLAIGEKIDIEEYCKKYPQYRDKIISKFRTAEFLNNNFQEEDLTGKKLGEYLILQELGRGGMGIVFLGIHPALSRLTAIKVLPPSFIHDKTAVKNFQEEAKIIAKFNHPNIVPIYSISEEKGLYYIAMGYIPGLALKDIIGKIKDRNNIHTLKANIIRDMIQELPAEKHDISQKSITLKREAEFWNKSYFQFVASIGAEIADALSYAHHNGIFHGDLKPSNILFTHDGIPMIVDFGLSKDVKKLASEKSKEFAGTLAYAAPEQIKENAINEKTDIWSLGVTLYELLILKNPFIDTTVKRTADKILKAVPLPLRHYNKKIPIELEAIVLKCLGGKPENRYHSVAELSKDLNNYLESKPLIAKPDNIIRKTRKAIIRRPARAIGIILFIISLLIGSYVGAEKLLMRYANSTLKLLKQDKEMEAKAKLMQYKRFARFFPISKDFTHILYYTFGQYYMKKNDYNGVINIFMEYLKLDPYSSSTYSSIGLAYGAMAEDDKAMFYFQNAIKLDPNNKDAYWYLANIYYIKKQYAEAIDALKKVYDLTPYYDDKLISHIGVCLFHGKGFRETDVDKFVDYLVEKGFSNKQISEIYDMFKYMSASENERYQEYQNRLEQRLKGRNITK